MITERKAIKFHGPRDCRMTVEALEPLKDDEVLVESVYDLISQGSEKISFKREYDAGMHRAAEEREPYCSGYSLSGKVLKVGKAVTGYKEGDLVYANAKHRQYVNVPAGKLAKIPEGVTMEQASLMTVLRAGLYANWLGQVKMTDTVVVLGLGLFGVASLEFALLSGARKVIAVDPIPERAERARQLGAHLVYNQHGIELYDEIYHMTGMKMVDCVIDATDDASGLEAASRLVRSNGHIVVISDPPNAQEMIFPGIARRRGLNIHGLWINMINDWVNNYGYDGWYETYGSNPFYPRTLDEVHESIFQYILDGRINAECMITGKAAPSKCQETYEMLCSDGDRHLGVVFDWTMEK